MSAAQGPWRLRWPVFPVPVRLKAQGPRTLLLLLSSPLPSRLTGQAFPPVRVSAARDAVPAGRDPPEALSLPVLELVDSLGLELPPGQGLELSPQQVAQPVFSSLLRAVAERGERSSLLPISSLGVQPSSRALSLPAATFRPPPSGSRRLNGGLLKS